MVLYTLYFVTSKIYHVYDVAMFSKHIFDSAVFYSSSKPCIYNIEEEIWEILDNNESEIFQDFICVS